MNTDWVVEHRKRNKFSCYYFYPLKLRSDNIFVTTSAIMHLKTTKIKKEKQIKKSRTPLHGVL